MIFDGAFEMTVTDGGAAFPNTNAIRLADSGLSHWENDGDKIVLVTSGGMSLRDWFAGQAMAATIARIPLGKSFDAPEEIPSDVVTTQDYGEQIRAACAKLAYLYADAMLKARDAK